VFRPSTCGPPRVQSQVMQRLSGLSRIPSTFSERYSLARAQLLGLPEQVSPVAYLLGLVTEFLPTPDLERAGWRERVPLQDLLHHNRWGIAVPDAEMFGVTSPPSA